MMHFRASVAPGGNTSSSQTFARTVLSARREGRLVGGGGLAIDYLSGGSIAGLVGFAPTHESAAVRVAVPALALVVIGAGRKV